MVARRYQGSGHFLCFSQPALAHIRYKISCKHCDRAALMLQEHMAWVPARCLSGHSSCCTINLCQQRMSGPDATFSTSTQVTAELPHMQGSATAPQPPTECPHQIQAQEAQHHPPLNRQLVIPEKVHFLYITAKMYGQGECIL